MLVPDLKNGAWESRIIHPRTVALPLIQAAIHPTYVNETAKVTIFMFAKVLFQVQYAFCCFFVVACFV